MKFYSPTGKKSVACFSLIFALLLFVALPVFSMEDVGIADSSCISIQRAFSETLMRSIQISLQELKEPKLAQWMETLTPPEKLEGKTLTELKNSLQEQLLQKIKVTQFATCEVVFNKAVKRSAAFLMLDSRLLEEKVLLEKPENQSVKPLPFTFEVENSSSIVAGLTWSGVDEYTKDRLGPLKILISNLTPKDRLILTNASVDAVTNSMTDAVSLTTYNLPISSYGKVISLVEEKQGRKTLVISSFDSKAYLMHFGLMINRYRRIEELNFSILEWIDPKSLATSYQQLVKFAENHPDLFTDVDAIVVGYDGAFREKWQQFSLGSAWQKGFTGENWGVYLHIFPEGQRVAVLAGDVDYYGEGLVEQLEQLHARFPFKKLFFGGSGGAMIPRPIYEMYYPTVIHSMDGFEVVNVLQSSEAVGTHVSVNSPLYETPLWLNYFQEANWNTVDMEAGHLARLGKLRGVEVGVGILITDFPVNFGSLDVTLGKQNFLAKHQSRADFVNTVEAYIRRGTKNWFHFIEKLTNQSIYQISAKNLQEHRREIGVVSKDEREMLHRLFSLPFRLVVRMDPGRLHWTLKDGALFSTGLLNSLKVKTDPFTPKLEDEMFGAFDYIFASWCTDLGQKIYGDVIVILKQGDILPRSWGSRASGWRVAGYAKGSPLEVHQQNFLKEVLHPDHYREAIELQAVYRWRRLKAETKKMLLSKKTEEWPDIIYDLGFGKLELKIKSHVLVNEIERVMLPKEAQGEIPSMLKKAGIPFEYYEEGEGKE